MCFSARRQDSKTVKSSYKRVTACQMWGSGFTCKDANTQYIGWMTRAGLVILTMTNQEYNLTYKSLGPLLKTV